MADANYNGFTRLPASPYAFLPTRPGRLPDEKQLHDGAPRDLSRRTLEFSGDSDSQHDTGRPRSSVRHLTIHHLHAPQDPVTEIGVPSSLPSSVVDIHVPPPPPPPPPPISIDEMNVPPPPPPISFAEINVPPPPPPMNKFLPGGFYPSVTPMAHLSAESEKLDREQDSLRNLRYKLIGARFAVAAKRQKLRDSHIESGAMVGHTFNLLRQYLNEIGANVPSNISRAFADAASSRDRLGHLEVEYEEAELSYNNLEWKYSRRETRFVEGLLNNNLVPSDTLDRSQTPENLEILQLTRSMTPSTNDDIAVLDLASSSDEIGTRSVTDLSAFLAEQSLATTLVRSTRIPQPSSPWKSLSDLTLVRTKSAEDYNPIHAHLRWVEKMDKINNWLFDTVDISPLQKLSLKAMHDFGFTDTRAWWEHTKWLLIQDYSTQFHSGDSTVFDRAVDGRGSESAEEGSSSNSSITESSSADQMLFGIQSAAVPDTVALSGTTKSGDYQETKHQARIPRGLPAGTKRELISVEMAQISQNRAPAIPRQKIGPQTPCDRTQLPKRHKMPEAREMRPQETAVLPVNIEVTSFSSGRSARPIVDPDTHNHRQKVSSHTRITLHQSSESEQSSSLATSNPKSPPTKESVSTMDRYRVM